MSQSVQKGDPVIFVDDRRRAHHALVTAVHGENAWGEDERAQRAPSINLAFVSGDEERTDSYGRQIERQSSIVHRAEQEADGLYWYLPDGG